MLMYTVNVYQVVHIFSDIERTLYMLAGETIFGLLPHLETTDGYIWTYIYRGYICV